MLLLQIFAILLFVGLITLAVLAFIEPGSLTRRSRAERGRRSAQPAPDSSQPQQATSEDQ
jgi:hypothetical protein